MKVFDFIKDMFTNYLIRKTYESEIKNLGDANQRQIELMLNNSR